MAELKGTNVPAEIVPYTNEDNYATHDEMFGRGGYRSVNSIAEMNSIPTDRRKEGMLVNVIGDKIYKLTNGSFVDAGLEGGSGGGSEIEIIELPQEVSDNIPYDDNYYEGNDLVMSMAIKNIASNTLKKYRIKIGDYIHDVIMSYKAGYYDGFYIPNADGILEFFTDESLSNGNYSISSHNTVYLKQDRLVSGTNIKTINGNSILGSGNLDISGGSGGSGEVYVTSLNLEKIYNDHTLTQAEYNEIVNIYNKWVSRIPVITIIGTYKGVLNINTSSAGTVINNKVSFNIAIDEYVYTWNVIATVGKRWEKKVFAFPIKIDLSMVSIDDTNYSADENSDVYKSLELLDSNKSSEIPIFVISFDGEWGMFPLTCNEYQEYFYFNNNGRIIRIDYSFDYANKTVTYTVSNTTKYDLSIEVKTASDGIYYRIKERVPYGYIQFVRKKKHKYYSNTLNTFVKRTGYSVLGLDFIHSSGVSAMDLTPNVWYKYPVTADILWSKYTKGSQLAGVAGVRTHNTIRLRGNVHARPIKYHDDGTVPNLRKTSVLRAGLQYNVIHPDYINGISAKVIFTQRGEVIPIDVRMTVDPKDFNIAPRLYFAVQ